MIDTFANLLSAKSTCLAALALLAILASTSAGCAGSQPDDLFQIDARGGAVLRFQGMDDLTQPGARWDGNGSFGMVYEQPDAGPGCYRLAQEDPKIYSMMAGGGLTLKPNRSYVISILLDCDFERPTEINIGVWTVDDNDKTILINLNGVPNETDGWQRWEWEFTADPRFGPDTTSRLYFRPFDFPEDGTCRIADIALVELPPKPLAPHAKGEGVTFRGGPGPLPMRIEEVKSVGDTIEVRTTGARYTFDLRRDTIAAEQLLERERPIAVWRSSLSLEGLEILSTTAKECVLANDSLTFGVQCDSLVMVAPQSELLLTCESNIGGRWNRFIAGHLLVIDDYGGIAVNPDIPLGSGRLARTQVLTDGLDFIGIADDTEFLSSAQPGWEIAWTVSPGERLALSVFPPRPFDWEQSFHMNWCLTFHGLSTERYPEWGTYLDVVVLWDFCHRGYGMSFGPRFIHYDEDDLRAHIAAVKQAGMHPINYMSAYFYYSRDPEEFVAEVARFKDTYGIEGIYSDGVPSQEWLVAYEEMRMLRELLGDGPIVLHTTGQIYNGGPPLALPDIFIPAVDTYATATYRGEWVPYEEGRAWPYPKYISSQYRKANCVGIQKGDRWANVSQIEQDLINLHYNGRASHWPGIDVPDYFTDRYYPALLALEQLWEERGAEPDFYEEHYLPKVRELTGDVRPE